MVKYVLLRRTSSLNNCSKLKGECTDVESGCCTSEGPTKPPQSQFENFSRDAVPLNSIKKKNLPTICHFLFHTTVLQYTQSRQKFRIHADPGPQHCMYNNNQQQQKTSLWVLFLCFFLINAKYVTCFFLTNSRYTGSVKSVCEFVINMIKTERFELTNPHLHFTGTRRRFRVALTC